MTKEGEWVFALWERSRRAFQQEGAACAKAWCNMTLWRARGRWVQEGLSRKCSWTRQLSWNLLCYRLWAFLQPSKELLFQITAAGRQLALWQQHLGTWTWCFLSFPQLQNIKWWILHVLEWPGWATQKALCGFQLSSALLVHKWKRSFIFMGHMGLVIFFYYYY